MRKYLLFLITFCFLFGIHRSKGQLILSEQTSAQILAQKLVGNGITISNATFTGNAHMAGLFNNISGTNLGIDSGIVLCTGRVLAAPPAKGINGDGINPAISTFPDNNFGLPGDPDLSATTGLATGDASILEFDFIPAGDSINFRYVFASDEYNGDFVCYFYDGFAFFISGPGITGLQNLALVPGTNIPVTSYNINGALNTDDGTDCRINEIYYVDNRNNTLMTYDGHTVVLTASSKVEPCQVYHLKLVIADLNNNLGVDSGVFLEAQSLSSNGAKIDNLTQTDPLSGKYYVVEGCSAGSVKIKRQYPSSSSQTVNLIYGGNALNTIDVQTLPSSVTIPANQTDVLLNIIPVIDNLPEGIESLKIYAVPNAVACIGANTQPSDSTEIEIRDYDTLSMNPRKVNICRNSSIQLNASTGYSVYAWDANSTLSNSNIANPTVIPNVSETTYYCTASIGNCHARDSVFVKWKDIELLSTKNINCKNGTTGEIKISAGDDWLYLPQFSLNNYPYQADSTFTNLPAGSHTIKVRDASGCIDSIVVNLVQAYPDLNVNIIPTSASCSGNPDGQVSLNVSGGLPSYQYSIDNGTNFQSSNNFSVLQGTYPVVVKDFNGCSTTGSAVVSLINNLTLAMAANSAVICEGSNTTLQAVSNAASYNWTPVSGLSSTTIPAPIAAPMTTTKYYVIATKGICTKKDSVIVNVNAAPIANAGDNISICFGASTSLNGSGGIQYMWSPGTYLSATTTAQPDVVKPLNDIIYSLQVKDANGCTSLNTATVKVMVTPSVQIFVPADTIAPINHPLQLYATDINNSGIISYEWTPAYGLNNSQIANPITTLDMDMMYTVTAKTADGCEGTAKVSVKIFEVAEIYVPTAFTPNGDTKNDILRAMPIGIKTFNYFTVFNRWGKMIFTTSDFSKGWDGKIQGTLQNTGSYVWIAEGIDYRGNIIQRKGSSILIR